MVRFFSALSSEHSINILLLLKEHPQCVNEIVHRLRLTQPAVSQHLRVLKEAGLVKAKKTGYWMHYEVDGVTSHGNPGLTAFDHASRNAKLEGTDALKQLEEASK